MRTIVVIKDWHHSEYRNHLQIVYGTNDGKYKFVLRKYSDTHWMAINLSAPNYGCGQILAEGRTDTHVFSEALKKICF